jgi:hypothetical protein
MNKHSNTRTAAWPVFTEPPRVSPSCERRLASLTAVQLIPARPLGAVSSTQEGNNAQ